MEITIREAEKSDFHRLYDLFEEENQFHCELAPDYIQPASQLLTIPELEEFIASSEQIIYVAAKYPTLLGAVIVSIKEEPEDRWRKHRRFGYIDDLVVTAAAQGSGIGGQLMRKARRWAASRGAQTVELHVWHLNRKARRFYESLGMRTLQHRMSWPI